MRIARVSPRWLRWSHPHLKEPVIPSPFIPKPYLVDPAPPQPSAPKKKKGNKTPARRLEHKHTSKHKATSTPKVQIPYISASKPNMVPKARARKNTTPSARVVRRIMNVLVPGITFLPGGITTDRRERDSGNAEGVIGKEIEALQCNRDPLGWGGRATAALGGGIFELGRGGGA